MNRSLAAIAAVLFSLSMPAHSQIQHSRLPGTKWECLVDNRPLGTVTFADAAVVELSWQDASQWKATPNGIEIFGVSLVYAGQTFTGVNASGKTITLIHVPEETSTLPAAQTMAASPPADATPPEAAGTPFEKLQTVKLARGNDHRYSISGQKVSFGKSTNRVWQTSWGSYIKEFERSATYQFKVSHIGSEGTAYFEVLFLGKTAEGGQYPYSFESRKMSVNGDTSFDFDIFLKSTESRYRSLNIRIREGSKPDSWVAWMRDGDTLMGLTAGRGSLVDRYEANPAELIALAREVVKP